MIKILGVKRVLTLAILVAVNAILAFAAYSVTLPQKEKAEAELRSTKANIAQRRDEMIRLKTEYEQIQQQKNLFEKLQEAGFFSLQDRLQARRTIEQIQTLSKILSTKYDIQAIQVQENQIAAASDHVILHTPVKITVDAMDDLDIYNFIYWVENSFPGHAGMTNIVIDRRLDIDETTLKQIGNSIPTVLVSATIDFSWDTMVPRTDIPQQLSQPATPQ